MKHKKAFRHKIKCVGYKHPKTLWNHWESAQNNFKARVTGRGVVQYRPKVCFGFMVNLPSTNPLLGSCAAHFVKTSALSIKKVDFVRVGVADFLPLRQKICSKLKFRSMLLWFLLQEALYVAYHIEEEILHNISSSQSN